MKRRSDSNKFSLFLRQADKDGIVIMKQGESGNYYLSPSDGPPSPMLAAPTKSGESSKDSQKKAGSRKESSRLSAATAAARRTLGRFRKDSASTPVEVPRKDEIRSSSQQFGKEASRTATGGASRDKSASEQRDSRKTTVRQGCIPADRPTNWYSTARPITSQHSKGS